MPAHSASEDARKRAYVAAYTSFKARGVKEVDGTGQARHDAVSGSI
jgi:hypothetical protein